MGYDPKGQAFLDVIKGFLGNIVSSIEGEIGVGFGLGLSLFKNGVKAEASRDATIIFDDGRFLAANVVSAEVSILDYGIGDTVTNYTDDADYNSDTDIHYHYDEGLIGNSYDIFTCERCSHSRYIKVPIDETSVKIAPKKDLVLSFGGSIHLGVGGHVNIGFNFTEFFDRIVEDWRK